MFAFANTHGGTLLIGVTDDGKVCGVLDEKNFEEYFSNIARNNVIPAIDINAQAITYENKKVIIVTIPKGKDKCIKLLSARSGCLNLVWQLIILVWADFQRLLVACMLRVAKKLKTLRLKWQDLFLRIQHLINQIMKTVFC